MKKITSALAILALAIAPTLALAGAGGTTCAGAQEVFPGQPYSGDTSGAGYSNIVGALGPLPSPANDAAYKFTSNGQATTAISFTPQYAGAIYLTTACAGSGPTPIHSVSANSGQTVNLPIDNNGAPLSAGTTYYVIVSGSPPAGATANGPFTFTTPDPLPVTLESFSID
jgi:hypothetical protein